MFEVTLEEDTIKNIDGSSEGTQNKFYHDKMWYKTDTHEEGEVEYLVSEMLAYSSLKPSEYISYENGFINGKSGCRSRDFLESYYELITFERAHQRILGKKLSSKMRDFDKMEEKIEYTLNFFVKFLKIDVFDYLQKVFSLDYLILNEDRHFNNLAILADIANDRYVTAPIFDNGKSLLNGCQGYRPAFSIEYNVNRVTARPFSGNHKNMFEYFGRGFSVNIDEAIRKLTKETQTLYRDVLLYQLDKHRNTFNN